MIDRTPHCCRHTYINMLTEASVDETIIEKIVEHSGAMTLTEKIYTHFDVKELVDVINKIKIKKGHSPVFLLKNVLYIPLTFVLYTCCICVVYRLKSSTSGNFPQPL